MGKLMCIGALSLATGLTGTVNVQVPRPMRPWRLSLVGDVAGVATTDYELGVKAIAVGGQPLTHNAGGAVAPWAGFVNQQGHAWDLTDDFGDDLADVPTASGDSGVQAEVKNSNAGTVNVVLIAAMMD